MPNETLGTVRRLLTALLDETDGSEVHYKLRTALQLLDAHENDLEHLKEVADDDAELRDRLQDLGYLS